MIRTLLDIMRLRSGPQDLPPGNLLAVALAVAWLAQGFLTDRALDEAGSAQRALLSIALQFGVIVALLNLRKQAARIPQTISALAGTGIIFGLLALVLVLQLDPAKPQPNVALAYLGLFIWSLVVDGHIYRHALSTKISLGILVAVLIFAANFILMRAMFG